MDIKRRVMPLVVTGAISLAAVGVPVFALAGSDEAVSDSRAQQATAVADNDQKAAEEAAAKAAAEKAAEEAAAEKAAADKAAAEKVAAEQAAAEKAAESARPAKAKAEAKDSPSDSDEGNADASDTTAGAEDGKDDKDEPNANSPESDDPAEDGDGTGSNEPPNTPSDDPATDPTDDPADDPADDPTDDPADDPADEPADDPQDTPADSTDDVTAPADETPASTTTDNADSAQAPKDAANGEDAPASENSQATNPQQAADATKDAGKAASDANAPAAADDDTAESADKPAPAEVKIEGADVKHAMAEVAGILLSNGFQSAYVGQSYTSVWHSSYLSTDIFIASIGEQARQIAQDNNLYASVMIAQAIIESDSGNSGLAQAPNNNLFGIKGSYEGKSVNMSTQEDNGSGGLYTIRSDFRKYPTQRESLEDYAALLRNDEAHYGKAWKESAATYRDAAKALQGTYATSTVYADSICAVIEAYDLTRFDKPANFKISGAADDGTPLTMADYTKLQALAVSYLGMPYTWGGEEPETGFDCSGFVKYLYKEALGIDLSRTTYTQQHEGTEVKLDDLRMGDLLFFSQGGDTYHVALYLGDGFYIHAPEPGDVIKVSTMESFTPSFAKRIVEMRPA